MRLVARDGHEKLALVPVQAFMQSAQQLVTYVLQGVERNFLGGHAYEGFAKFLFDVPQVREQHLVDAGAAPEVPLHRSCSLVPIPPTCPLELNTSRRTSLRRGINCCSRIGEVSKPNSNQVRAIESRYCCLPGSRRFYRLSH
jgi:hypothetical protein